MYVVKFGQAGIIHETILFDIVSSHAPLSASSIGATLAFLTSLPVQDGGPHDFRSKMAAPMTSDPRWRPPRRPIQDGGPHGVRSKMAAPRSQIRDGGPCDPFGYTSEGESTP